MRPDRLIVGLGNPGKAYERTRHNVGFEVVRRLADDNKIRLAKSIKYGAWVGHGAIEGREVLLLLPVTFMNRSGAAVARAVKDKEIDLSNILVVCDDFHLAFGQLRIRPQGSDGGHNGLDSVLTVLGTREVPRLRVGIGAPKASDDVVDFVLSPFSAGEWRQMTAVVEQAAGCCAVFLKDGVYQAMTQFNKRNNDEKV